MLSEEAESRGPLGGYRFIELAGIGPTQLAGMLLAEMGADVVRVEPPDAAEAFPLPPRYNLMNRSRRSVAVDLKRPGAADVVLRLVDGADALFEGFRPGVAERLGLGPEHCLARNPRLVYGRMTGWGQEGPLAGAVGHDANYIALSGALHAIGSADRPPTLPLNLVGDFGGGSLFLVAGLLAALLETARSGRGQVVDAAMVDGSAALMTLFHGLQAAGLWPNPRGGNFLDGGSHAYRAYETRDGKYVVVAALEPEFHAELMKRLGLENEAGEAGSWPLDPEQWPASRRRLAKVFKTRTRAEWCELLEGTSACLSPVLSLDEVAEHPHHRARGSYVESDGLIQPAPAPRFDRTPGAIRNPPGPPGEHTEEVLAAAGFDDDEIRRLAREGVISVSPA